jgi:hypothetical protein
MISFKKWLQKIFSPQEMQCRDISFDDVRAALSDSAVQALWLKEIVSKIQSMNMEIDNLLAKPDKDRIWETFAIERRTLLRCIEMILDAKMVLESEREALESQNRRAERIARATAAPLDLRQSE